MLTSGKTLIYLVSPPGSIDMTKFGYLFIFIHIGCSKDIFPLTGPKTSKHKTIYISYTNWIYSILKLGFYIK